MNEQKDKQTEEHSKDPNEFSMDQLRKETGQDGTEEYAAELAAPYAAPVQTPVELRELPVRRSEAEMEDRPQTKRKWLGYAALVLGILSMFVFPALFGTLAALLGVITYFQGNRALGIWSVLIGLISLAGYFLLVPLYA